MYILGLMGRSGGDSHDGSAAVLRDGKVVAAVEQERLSRNKHAPGEAPDEAAQACLDAAGVSLSEIDYITCGWKVPADDEGTDVSEFVCKSSTHTAEILSPEFWGYDDPPPIHFVAHHLSHAMAVIGANGVSRAACLIADGRAETASTTLGEYVGGEFERIDTYPISHSLGLLYDAASYYAGLGEFGGGKLMGLAAYGTPGDTDWIRFDEKTGEFEVPIDEHESSSAVFNDWVNLFESQFFPYRQGDSEAKSYYQNFAATVQRAVEEVVIDMSSYLRRQTSSDALVFGGGVALNSVLNQRLSRTDEFDDLYLHPASNDAGVSVGSAYELHRSLGNNFGKEIDPEPYTGPVVTDDKLTQEIEMTGNVGERMSLETLTKTVAADLAEGQIVGWFQGRSEFGPRALGHRSILADPSTREQLYVVNELKGRAFWRPLAPSVIASRFDEFFEADCSERLSKYMLTTATVSPEYRDAVPAVVHVDGTCRPQRVHASVTPRYHRLLRAFERETGLPLLINTSFNLSGMPIVNSPEEAVQVFHRSDQMDVLVLGKYYISSPSN